ncbi:ABC-type Fe3+ transport system substrate-binding protein [Paenibacillus forsythiae]|uniref:ABC-type Fe3+ transport system substrate-binding protein n=1 Tax=Paenibacillus forsythiae TaxID=365616 RepID=A0ABU3H8B7_9BACL|nr:ABC transporter substrate-binding protein [Paenibacillus forsythiae]MDT3427073.1 ABC-type Fe3+ transport system substrate-binding protein [Paenibacillus forsythiae]
MENISAVKEPFGESALTNPEPDSLERGADKPAGALDFLGNTTCPMKQIFREGLQEHLRACREQSGSVLECYVPSGCGGVDHFKEIRESSQIHELPGAIMTTGFGSFFSDRFVEAYVDKGYFRSDEKQRVNKDFAGKGFVDPEGSYRLYSVFPYVFLVDKTRCGSQPLPRRWSDLMHPAFANNVIIGGSRQNVAKVPLIYIRKEFGAEGLKLFAHQVKDAWHNTTIARTAGSVSQEGSAVYVVPWFFARSCTRTKATEIIWPEDGAYTGPMFMLVKSSEAARVSAVTRYIAGADYGKKSARNYYPALHPEVDNGLPSGASLKWLGWDYIRSHSLERLSQDIDDVFQARWS